MPSSAPLTSYRPPTSGALAQRKEGQVSAYLGDILHWEFIEETPLEFLNVPHDRLPSKITEVNDQVTLDTFVQVANTMAESMRDQYFAKEDLLVFKSTGKQSHGGHVTATSCKPDYTAAFMSDWGGEDTTLWPCIRLVGEKASQGKKPEDQKRQAMSSLHYLLLARPELNVAQGLFTSESEVMFLLGIGGVGIHSFSAGWGNMELHRLTYAFIYRLYDPGDFVDSSYVKAVPNLKEKFVTYNVQLAQDNGVDRNPITITNLNPIYASNPFGSRTHILSNPDSKVKINGERLTVLKEQLCRVGTPFDEYSILKRVHSPEKVPGVVGAVYHEVIKIPRDFCPSREKHRLGLRQMGKPLTSIPTVTQMLEIVFDTLEVLRYLRFERHVLHRDISRGNILFVEDDIPSSTGGSAGADETIGPEGLPLCYIKYHLGESNDPRKTSALLIDFNHAEHLESKRGPGHKRISGRTGTPLFMARAVRLGRAVVPYDNVLIIPEVPMITGRYGTCHPDRIKKFPYRPREISIISTEGTDPQWRHELDHDTESVYWVLLYWLVCAQPENEVKEPIVANIWAGLAGSVAARINLLQGRLIDATHSVYQPLWPLLEKLACILNVDRHWVESSNPRNDPGYINEAFQRLILQFMIEHRNESFMQHRVESQPRRPELMSGLLSLSSDTSRKRSLSEPTSRGGTKRLHQYSSDRNDRDESEDQFAGEVEEGLDEEE